MRLQVFQSDKGDCLLLSGRNGVGNNVGRVLIDGGMRDSYRAHVAAAVSRLRKLDLVYVSHIDQDHILGILQMMDDAIAWRVHEYQLRIGNAAHPRPSFPKPPPMDGIWHNAFHEQLGKNAGPIADMLAATAVVLSGAAKSALREHSEHARELATSEREAVQLSRRVGSGQLKIPLNQQFNGKLVFVREQGLPTVQIGSMSFFVIGPFQRDLEDLRKRWNEWLRKNQEFLSTVRRRAREDEERLGPATSATADDLDRLIDPLLAQADELGRRSEVTVPNLASLMLLVEESGKTIALTGDGHLDEILTGLRHHGRLADGDNAGVHLNVLKVQHHGSENNLNAQFCRQLTADHYVFCGNGEHKNPDPRVVETIIESRLGPDSRRGRHAGVDGRFKLWFNSSSRVEGDEKNLKHMRDLERLVERAQTNSGGRMTSKFMPANASSFIINV